MDGGNFPPLHRLRSVAGGGSGGGVNDPVGGERPRRAGRWERERERKSGRSNHNNSSMDSNGSGRDSNNTAIAAIISLDANIAHK